METGSIELGSDSASWCHAGMAKVGRIILRSEQDIEYRDVRFREYSAGFAGTGEQGPAAYKRLLYGPAAYRDLRPRSCVQMHHVIWSNLQSDQIRQDF